MLQSLMHILCLLLIKFDHHKQTSLINNKPKMAVPMLDAKQCNMLYLYNYFHINTSMLIVERS